MITDGLFDLQVNGYAGVDFNDAAIGPADLDLALEAMLESGVTGCLPTIITAGRSDLRERLAALDAAVMGSKLGPKMVPGYHLEGPFLNAAPGYSGCHPPQAMSDPDIEFVETLENGLSRPILLVTTAPEREGGLDFVEKLAVTGRIAAIGHSAADFQTVRAAADRGVMLSTHLGNGLPKELPKLQNTLLAQLAEPRLYACLIADGHHMSPEALKAIVTLKGKKRSILVTDAVIAAAAPVGRYRFAGMEIERRADGAVVQPDKPNLAGSALKLDEAVRNVVAWDIAALGEAVNMASLRPRGIIAQAASLKTSLPAGQVRWNSANEPTVITLD